MNVGSFRSGQPDGTFSESTAPEAFPIVDDLRVEPVPDMTGHLGVQMRWVSDTLGVVAVFPWWDHLERDADLRSIVPDGVPIGTPDEPFLEIDMNWGIRIWRNGPYVYVVHDGGAGWNTWFRVPIDVFLAAWQDGIDRIRATDASASPKEGGRRG